MEIAEYPGLDPESRRRLELMTGRDPAFGRELEMIAEALPPDRMAAFLRALADRVAAGARPGAAVLEALVQASRSG